MRVRGLVCAFVFARVYAVCVCVCVRVGVRVRVRVRVRVQLQQFNVRRFELSYLR